MARRAAPIDLHTHTSTRELERWIGGISRGALGPSTHRGGAWQPGTRCSSPSTTRSAAKVWGDCRSIIWRRVGRPTMVLRAVRNDRLPLSVSSGWVLLPPSIAAALSPLSFDLERRVLNRYPQQELPSTLQSRAYTWSQVCGFRRLYARTRAEQPRGLFAE